MDPLIISTGAKGVGEILKVVNDIFDPKPLTITQTGDLSALKGLSLGEISKVQAQVSGGFATPQGISLGSGIVNGSPSTAGSGDVASAKKSFPWWIVAAFVLGS